MDYKKKIPMKQLFQNGNMKKYKKIKQGKQGQKKVTYEFLLKDLVYCGRMSKRDYSIKSIRKQNEPFIKGASFCCSVFL